MSKRPTIGVFDSGVGGLTVLKELVGQVPHADYLYFGDTARLPYGSKSVETVAKYAISSAHYLQEQGAQMLVIACNTATALAMDKITKAVKVPVVGVVEPGAERAAEVSRTRRAVVIGTEATVSSHAYQRALTARGLEASERACPLLVPLVEEGWIEHPVTEQVARIYLDELFNSHEASRRSAGHPVADVLVLGCTHYPLIRPLLQRVAEDIAGKDINIVDSAESTARAVAQKIESGDKNPHQPKLQFFATDSVEKFRRLGARFMGHDIEHVKHVDIEL